MAAHVAALTFLTWDYERIYGAESPVKEIAHVTQKAHVDLPQYANGERLIPHAERVAICIKAKEVADALGDLIFDHGDYRSDCAHPRITVVSVYTPPNSDCVISPKIVFKVEDKMTRIVDPPPKEKLYLCAHATATQPGVLRNLLETEQAYYIEEFGRAIHTLT